MMAWIDTEGGPFPGPRRLLVNDEGNSTLHFFDLDVPERNWMYRGAGRDLQLIGQQRVLRSAPLGYVELDLSARGARVREISIAGLPGGIESARRLTNGHTVLAGNGGGGIFIWEVDSADKPIPGRVHLFAGIDKVRMIRLTGEGTFLFCSETNGRSVIHELGWNEGMRTLFEVPDDVPADSMVKAVRIAPHVVTVSTGYAASLLVIDTEGQRLLQTIGGRGHLEPRGAERPLSPFFFSGYQMLPSRDFLLGNWQGHSSERNGQGYQLLRFNAAGDLIARFDQTRFPLMSSLNNVIALDDLDTARLHDEPNGILVPMSPTI